VRGPVFPRAGGAGLTKPFAPAFPLPPSFRGSILYGDEAARAASRVSGPFSADPSAFVRPANDESLSHLLDWAWREGVPVIPRGAGTGMPGGNLGSHLVVEIGSSFADAALASEGSGSRVRAGAGCVVSDVEQLVAEAGATLPFLPSSARWCTAGGLVANNGAGARSFGHGAAAAHVRVIEGIFAWGEPFRAGDGEPVPEPFQRLQDELRGRGGGARNDSDTIVPPEVGGWPLLRKNSSGYALDRFLRNGDPVGLLAGSEGTLAFLTAVEFDTVPAPLARGLAILPARTPEELQDIALAADELGTVTCEFLGRRFLEISGMESDPEVGALVRGSHALVLLEVEVREEVGSRHPEAPHRETHRQETYRRESEGPESRAAALDDVNRRLGEIRKLGEELGGGGISATDPAGMHRLWGIRHAASPIIARQAEHGLVSTQFIEDSVVPPERLADYLRGLDDILDENGFDAVVFGHAGDGNVHVNPLVDVASQDWEVRVRRTLDAVTGLVAGLGGTLAGEHGDGRLRAPLLERIWGSAHVETFRRVKDTLDPRGILNPGVILPLPGQDPLDGFTPRPRSWPV